MNVNEINFLFAVERRSFISAAGQACEGLQCYHLGKKNLRSTTETREVQGEPRQLGHHLSGTVKTRLSKDLSLVGLA